MRYQSAEKRSRWIRTSALLTGYSACHQRILQLFGHGRFKERKASGGSKTNKRMAGKEEPGREVILPHRHDQGK